MEGLDLGGKEYVCNLTIVHIYRVHTHTAEDGEIGKARELCKLSRVLIETLLACCLRAYLPTSCTEPPIFVLCASGERWNQ